MTNKLLRLLALAALANLGAPGTVHAQKLALDAEVGYDGRFVEGLPARCRVTVENPGGAFEGKLIAKQPDRGWTTETPVSVSARGESVYNMMFYQPRHFVSGTVIELRKGNSLVGASRISASPLGMDETALCVIGESSQRLSRLNGLVYPGFGAPRQIAGSYAGGPEQGIMAISGTAFPKVTAKAVLAIPSSEAFENSHLYSPARTVILSGFSPRDASPKALEAIRNFASQGGMVLVTAEPDVARFRDKFYSEILPVNVNGAGQLSLPGGSSAFAANVTAKSGARTVESIGGRGVLFARPFGLGQVAFLSVDPGSNVLQAWAGFDGMFKTALSLQQMRMPLRLGDDIHEPIVTSMSTFAHEAPPSTLIVGLFLAAYVIFLVPLNYLFVTRRDRKEWGWVSTPAIVVAFSVVAWLIGVGMRGNELLLNQFAMLESGADGRGQISSLASLFSPATSRYELSVPSGSLVTGIRKEPSPYGGAPDDKTRIVHQVGQDADRVHVNSLMWTGTNLHIQYPASDAGGLEADLMYSGTLRGNIANKSRRDLEKVYVYYQGHTYSLGALRAGGTASVQSGSAATSQPTPSPAPGTPPKAPPPTPGSSVTKDVPGPVLADRLMVEVRQLAQYRHDHTAEAIVVARQADAAQNIRISRKASKESASVWIAYVPVRIAGGMQVQVRGYPYLWGGKLMPGRGDIRDNAYYSGGGSGAGDTDFRVAFQVPAAGSPDYLGLGIDSSTVRDPKVWNWQRSDWDNLSWGLTGATGMNPAVHLSPSGNVLVSLTHIPGTQTPWPTLTAGY